uniref:Serine/threonine-protein phosphatase n=1 Tax=Caenorhabditis tropicalis TaxID=1561998 RepID=A0A1I7UP68_9PELO
MLVDIDKESFTTMNFIFLGDYVDRGPSSLRCLELLAYLRILFGPEKIRLLRGNHETQPINASHGFKKECIRLYGVEDGTSIFVKWNVAFSFFSVIGRIKNFGVICHGSIGPDTDLSKVNDYKKPIHTIPPGHMFESFLWADPKPGLDIGPEEEMCDACRNSLRGASHFVKEEYYTRWCEDNGIPVIYRAHMHCPFGIRINTTDGSVMTIFSSANYEGYKIIASTLTIYKDGSRTIISYESEKGVKKNVVLEPLTVYQIEQMALFKANFQHDIKRKRKEEQEKLKKAGKLGKIKHIAARALAPKKKYKKRKASSSKKGKRNFSSSKKAAVGVTGVIAGTAIISSISALVPAGSTPSSSVPASLIPFPEKTHTIARFVNSISLGQTSDIDKKALTQELFPIGPTLTLDDLEKLNMTQLAGDVGSIQKAIESQCSGDEGCAVSEEVLDGMKSLKALKAHVPTVEKSLNVFRVDELKEVTQLNLGNDWNSTLVANLETNLRSAKTVVASVGSIETELQSLKPEANAINTFKTKIASTKLKYQELSGAFNNNTLKTVSSGVNRILLLNPFALQQRNMTAGFLNGYNDLKLAAKDDENSWLMGFLNNGKKLEAVSPKLATLEGVVKQLGPFNTSYELFKAQSNIQFWVLLVQLTEAGQSLSQLSGLVSNVNGCVQHLDLSVEYTGKVDNLLTKMSFSEEHKSQLNQTNVVLVQSSELFEKAKKLLNKVKEVQSADATADSLIKDPLFNQMISALKKFGIGLSTLNLGSLESWLSQIKIPKLTAGFRKWNEDTGFLTTMDCLKNDDFVGMIQGLNPSLKSMNGVGMDLDLTKKFAGSIGNLTSEWIKLKPLLSTKPKRSADVQLKNSEKISKDLGDVASIINKLHGIEENEKDLMVILQGKQAISESIDSISDPKTKENLKKMWTEENIKAFESNMKTAKSLMNEVKDKEIKKMIDFKDPFEKAAKVSACGIDLRQLAVMLRGRIKDTKVATSLESSKSVDVSFVSHKKTDFGPMLTDLQEYFDSVFPCTGDDCSSDGLSGWTIAFIAGGTIVGVGGAGAFGYFVIYKRWFKKEEKKEDEEKESASAISPISDEASTAKKIEPKLVSNAKINEAAASITKGNGVGVIVQGNIKTIFPVETAPSGNDVDDVDKTQEPSEGGAYGGPVIEKFNYTKMTPDRKKVETAEFLRLGATQEGIDKWFKREEKLLANHEKTMVYSEVREFKRLSHWTEEMYYRPRVEIDHTTPFEQLDFKRARATPIKNIKYKIDNPKIIEPIFLDPIGVSMKTCKTYSRKEKSAKTRTTEDATVSKETLKTADDKTRTCDASDRASVGKDDSSSEKTLKEPSSISKQLRNAFIKIFGLGMYYKLDNAKKMKYFGYIPEEFEWDPEDDGDDENSILCTLPTPVSELDSAEAEVSILDNAETAAVPTDSLDDLRTALSETLLEDFKTAVSSTSSDDFETAVSTTSPDEFRTAVSSISLDNLRTAVSSTSSDNVRTAVSASTETLRESEVTSGDVSEVASDVSSSGISVDGALSDEEEENKVKVHLATYDCKLTGEIMEKAIRSLESNACHFQRLLQGYPAYYAQEMLNWKDKENPYKIALKEIEAIKKEKEGGPIVMV